MTAVSALLVASVGERIQVSQGTGERLDNAPDLAASLSELRRHKERSGLRMGAEAVGLRSMRRRVFELPRISGS